MTGIGITRIIRSLALCALAFPLVIGAADSPVLVGVVQRVIDADTIDVQLDSGLIRVRLNAIDAPERGQPGGKDATAYLTQRVANKRVELEPSQQDRYSRLVAVVHMDGVNINSELVERGYAWAFRRYMKKSDAKLCAAEYAARQAKRGLWSLPKRDRLAPWEYRKRKDLAAFTDYSSESASECVAAIGKRGS